MLVGGGKGGADDHKGRRSAPPLILSDYSIVKWDIKAVFRQHATEKMHTQLRKDMCVFFERKSRLNANAEFLGSL